MVEVIHESLGVTEFNYLQGVLAPPGIVHPIFQGSAALLIMTQLLLLFLQVPQSGQEGVGVIGTQERITNRSLPGGGCEGASDICQHVPAVNLGLDAAPAVRHLANQLHVLGQVHVAFVGGVGDLTVPMHCFGQVRLQSCHQVSLELQVTFHLLQWEETKNKLYLQLHARIILENVEGNVIAKIIQCTMFFAGF